MGKPDFLVGSQTEYAVVSQNFKCTFIRSFLHRGKVFLPGVTATDKLLREGIFRIPDENSALVVKEAEGCPGRKTALFKVLLGVS